MTILAFLKCLADERATLSIGPSEKGGRNLLAKVTAVIEGKECHAQQEIDLEYYATKAKREDDAADGLLKWLQNMPRLFEGYRCREANKDRPRT